AWRSRRSYLECATAHITAQSIGSRTCRRRIRDPTVKRNHNPRFPATRGPTMTTTTSTNKPAPTHLDVLIVGAGISRIAAAYHLKTRRPDTTFAILEGSDAIGGTWNLFRYPGIRSDSDMPTFGFSFKPWTHKKSIADAHIILDYLRETVTENGLEE